MMVSITADLGKSRSGMVAESADRWIFVFMAVLLLVTVLVGFIPSSIEKIAAVQSGQRPAFPPVLHVHAVLMGSWVALLFAQTSLIATRHRAAHQKLGFVAVIVMPAMVVTGFALVPETFRSVWALDSTVVPMNVIAETKAAISNIALMQIRVGILFPAFVTLALLVRRKDPATHKRLMILASLLPLPAAVDRIGWLPTTMPSTGVSPDLYVLLWSVPLLAYDLIRHRRISRAYAIWLVASLPLTVVVHVLWGSPWWMATVPKLMGVESW